MMHFLSSMRADRCIADADVQVDIAHVLMLDKQKIIDRDIAKQLLPALLKLYDEGIPEEVFDDRFEDVHAGIESLLIEAAGQLPLMRRGYLERHESLNITAAALIQAGIPVAPAARLH